MKLKAVMDANNGYWDGQYAMIHVAQTVRCVAIGGKDAYTLTPYGEKLVEVCADTSPHVVKSVSPRIKRKQAQPKLENEPVVEPVKKLDDEAPIELEF